MPKIIVLEGTDGSGKETQANLLVDFLNQQNIKAKKVSFPCYEDSTSVFVKKYLNGDFGLTADSVSPKEASLFYALDRYGWFKSHKKEFDDADILVFDRYVGSNIIHQGCKISADNRMEFIYWLENLEFGILSIPRPDITFFLEVPPEKSQELRDKRMDLKNGQSQDIHEKDRDFLKKSYQTAMAVNDILGWNRISCVNETGDLRSAKDISKEIQSMIMKID